MKLKKNSLIILGLSAVALGTIGFSSWIIAETTPTEPVDSNVNVTVGDVVDPNIFLELPQQTDNIIFDADSDAEDKGTVVTATEDSQEKMTFTASFIIGGASQQDFEAAYSSKSVAVQFTSDDLSSLITSECVQSPIVLGEPVTIDELNTTFDANTGKITGDSYTNPSDTSKYEITFSAGTPSPTGENKGKYGVQVNIAFTFAWGSAFDNKNPVCLKSIDDAAKAALAELDKANDFKLAVKISLVGRAAQA